jgi:tungstate transport system ATP-binding protein
VGAQAVVVSAAVEAGILPLRLERVSLAIGGRQLLDAVDFTVEAGDRLLVLGPNGAGKSLLLRVCHGLVAASSGRVRWASGEARPVAQAMVFQRPVLLRRSVAANLAYPLRMRGLPARAWRQRVAETLERFGLAALAERPARQLSGGEQQRLALARAWVMQPRILFLDEPCSATDPSATRAIEAMIMAFSEAGVTIVMTSHDLGQVRRLASTVGFLHAGRLLEHRAAERFFSAPGTAEARAFLAGDLLW